MNKLKQVGINALGWRSKERIVIFESDDWGMIRTSSKESYNSLKIKGYPVDKCVYNRNDALETDEDVSKLMEVLAKHKGSDDKPAKFTMNNVVANPDFQRIEAADFTQYYFQVFTETLAKDESSTEVFKLYQQGIKAGVFQPQFHGREHVNINRWLGALQNNDKRFMDAFKENMFTVAGQGRTSGRRDYLDAFGRAYDIEIENEESIIASGLALFEKIWGFKSQSFIAPCYVWSPEIEKYLVKGGVKYIQGTHVQRIPSPEIELKIQKKYHWQGRKNKSGLTSIVRNVMFEPVEQGSDPAAVDKALAQIESAFFWRKPAVISSHRVNYMGRLRPENRDKNLKLLDDLLYKIVKKYPEVRFMSSDELGNLYNK